MNPAPQLAHIWVEQDAIPARFHPDHHYLIESRFAARGYGVSVPNLRSHKHRHADELLEGRHWISVAKSNADTRNGEPKRQTFWTKRGIVRLGFFIKSERAKRFRDAAEDLVIDQISQAPAGLPWNLDRRLELLESNQQDIINALAALRPASPAAEEARAARSEKARAARSRPPTAEELRQMEIPAVTPAPAPPLLLTSGRVYKGHSISMHPDHFAESVARAAELGLTWSAYARRCMKIEQSHRILATPGEASSASYTVTLPAHLSPVQSKP